MTAACAQTISSDMTEETSQWEYFEDDLKILAAPMPAESMEDIQMKLCDLFTDPESTVPSIVQGTSRLLPALLGLEDEQLYEDGTIDSSEDHAYFRAKISLNEEEDKHDESLGDDSTDGSTSPPTVTISPISSQRRRLPRLPMISDNTVDRRRQLFLDQDIPHVDECTANHRSVSPNAMGKIEIFCYNVFGHTSKLGSNNRHHRQQISPTSQQVNQLRCIATRLGKVIQSRRKQQQLQHQVHTLKESNRRLVESQHLANIGQWELDLTVTHNALYWSDYIYELFRINKKEFGASYEGFLNVIHPEDRQMVDKAYTDSLKTKQPYDIVHRLLLKNENDGSDEVLWVREICRTEYDESTGKPLYSVGIVQDITKERRAKEFLLEGRVGGLVSSREKRRSTTTP